MPFGMSTRESTRYSKVRDLAILRGQPYTYPALGTKRRLQALYAIGYSSTDVSRATGVSPATIKSILKDTPSRGTVWASTAKAIGAFYQAHYMKPKAGGYAGRQRTWAVRKLGYAPPLAWDDIDRDEYPTGVEGQCSEIGCNKPETYKKRRLCKMHYERGRRAA